MLREFDVSEFVIFLESPELGYSQEVIEDVLDNLKLYNSLDTLSIDALPCVCIDGKMTNNFLRWVNYGQSMKDIYLDDFLITLEIVSGVIGHQKKSEIVDAVYASAYMSPDNNRYLVNHEDFEKIFSDRSTETIFVSAIKA